MYGKLTTLTAPN